MSDEAAVGLERAEVVTGLSGNGNDAVAAETLSVLEDRVLDLRGGKLILVVVGSFIEVVSVLVSDGEADSS